MEQQIPDDRMIRASCCVLTSRTVNTPVTVNVAEMRVACSVG